jgi:hypothetical protein
VANDTKHELQIVSFVFWKVIVDGEARHLSRPASEDSDDANFADAKKRMFAMQL